MLGGRAENARLEHTRQRIGYGKPIKPKQPTHFQASIYGGMTAAKSG